MALKTNGAEGGTDTTTVTTGNSGGASGDAWSAVTIGAGAGLTFSATQAMHGFLSYKLVNANAVTTHYDWTGYATTQMAFRAYIRLNGSLPGAAFRPIEARTSTVGVGRVITNASNQLVYQTNNGSTTLKTFTNALSLDTWYRIEGVCEAKNASNATFKLDYYLGDSMTPVETGYSSTTVSSGTTSNITQIFWGNGGGITWTGTEYMDDLAAQDGVLTYIGPAPGAGARRVVRRRFDRLILR